ncbi:MAG: hypothetical protein Q8L48_27960 [Archangium sp.]|nr:hypothetical protein [Archangium sp.]
MNRPPLIFSSRGPRSGGLTREGELRSALLALSIYGADRALIRWISRHHGTPHTLDAEQTKALRAELDSVTLPPGLEDSTVLAALRGRVS